MNNIATLKAPLNPNAKLYSILAEQPQWWTDLIQMKGVYVEVRKGEIVDVYDEGGRMAEIKCNRGECSVTRKQRERLCEVTKVNHT